MEDNPINLVIPNTSKQKMQAIVALSEAVKNISKALISVQVDVTIANNIITDSETGITVQTEDDNQEIDRN